MGFAVEERWKELRREVRRRERDQEGLQQIRDTTKREKTNCEKAQQSSNSGKEERRRMENFPQHIKEEEKGEMERQSFPLVGSEIEKEEIIIEAVQQMGEVVKEKQEGTIGLKREEEEEIVKQEWEEQMELEQAQPEHNWSEMIEKGLMIDFPQSAQELIQEDALEEGPRIGSSNSEQDTEMSLHELNKLIESESQKEKNLQD
jgi:hypothetical protein